MANKIEDLDLFVSIHHNASSNKNANRSEVIYKLNNRDAQLLAECISNQLGELGEDIEVKIYSRYNSKGTDYYSVLRHTNAPAVIVEVSFITSEEGLALVDSKEERERNGVLIAHGILDYLEIDYSDNAKDVKEIKKETKKVENKKANSLDALLNVLNNKKKKNKGLDILNSILGRD